jgi:hypothetical protein
MASANVDLVQSIFADWESAARLTRPLLRTTWRRRR